MAFLKKLKIEQTNHSAIPLLVMYPKALKKGHKRCMHTMFKTTLFTTAKRSKQPKYPSMDEWKNKIQFVYTYTGVLFRLKKKGNPIVCYNMDKPLGHYAK